MTSFKFWIRVETRAVAVTGEAEVYGRETQEAAEALLRDVLQNDPALRIDPRDDAPHEESPRG